MRRWCSRIDDAFTWRASASNCFRAISALTRNRRKSSVTLATLCFESWIKRADSSGPKLDGGTPKGSPLSLRMKSAIATSSVNLLHSPTTPPAVPPLCALDKDDDSSMKSKSTQIPPLSSTRRLAFRGTLGLSAPPLPPPQPAPLPPLLPPPPPPFALLPLLSLPPLFLADNSASWRLLSAACARAFLAATSALATRCFISSRPLSFSASCFWYASSIWRDCRIKRL
mmetsp:Transcript_41536/g.81658  ORF Transcript_41536/g.81658 Transcript_41536/m.81658 type:complete len:227 (-) Transcript_41536:263-943(-)